MADNLDPEIVAQFQEAMRQATEAAKELPMAMNATFQAINKATEALKKNKQATDASTAAEEKAAATTKAKTALEEAEEEALKKILKAQQLQENALNSAKNSLVSFGDALLSGTRGFEKYGQAMRGAGDAAYDFGKSLGPLGAVLGGIVKGATMVGSAMMKQADDVLKATDDLSKMGTAGAFSAEQVRKMGTGLGLASDQLDKFTKPVKSLGSSLISLGGNAADGTKQFAELAKVTSEQRQAYQRLGVSQEELIQNTADYINLQTQQGRQITDQMKRDGSLKTAAREYTDNLLELAALTGKDIDAVKKKNELAMAEIETAIQNNLLDQEINRLRKMDTAESRARADQLEKERKARDKLLQRVENEVGDPALRKGLAKFLATGAITEEVAALKRIGVPVEEFAAKIKQGKDVSDEFMDSLSKNGDAMMKNVGTAALYDENTRKAFGVSAEYLNYLAKARDRDEKSQSDLIKARIADTKAGKGAAGEDPAQKARNALTEAEIKAKVALDDLVASANPLLNNFENMNIATKALIVAAGVATAALGLMAAAALKNAAQGAMNTLRGAGGELLDKVKGIGGPSVAKAAKIGGGIAAVGMGAYQMYAGNKEINEQEKRGEISAAVAKDKRQDNTYGAAGGTAGALVGGALGSMLGPLGTVVGGYLGQMAGEKIGKWAASWDDDKNPELADSKKAAEAADKKVQLERERIAQEQAASDQSVSEAERKLAATRLAAIQKQEAQLLYEEALRELKKAKTKEETDAALAKSDRAQKQLAELKSQDAVRKIENAATEREKKNAEEQLIQARRHSALIDENRAIWNLKNAKTEEEKKAIQAQIDQIRKNRDEEIAALTGKKDEKSAEATSAGKPDQGYGSGRLVTVEDVKGYADGGTIPGGKIGLVGERGPEFISGPAQITNLKQMIEHAPSVGIDQIDESTEDFIDTFYETDKSVKDFDKELSGFVKDDPAGKMTKQLNLVTTALEDLNEMINPNASTGLDLLGSTGKTKVPSAHKIASAVMSQLSGIFGSSMPTAGGGSAGGGSVATPAGKSKSKGFLGALASALGFSRGSDTAVADSGGKDSGEAIPTPTGSTDMLDTTKSAKSAQATPVGNMSEEDIKKMIIRHEGVRYKPYKDSLGLWTVGIGHLIGDGRSLPASWNREFSKEEVLGLFEKDYEHHRKAAEQIPGFDKMNTVGQGAMTDLTFNMGPAWINKWPNTRKKLEQGDMVGAAENLEDSKWFTQVGNRAPTIVNMVRQGMKAAAGGIFSGPTTGYPVEMHGTELVTRLDPNSILEKLAKMPAQQMEQQVAAPAGASVVSKTDDTMKEVAAINAQMMEMLADKLDTMINKLEVSNDTQDKLLKYSQV